MSDAPPDTTLYFLLALSYNLKNIETKIDLLCPHSVAVTYVAFTVVVDGCRHWKPDAAPNVSTTNTPYIFTSEHWPTHQQTSYWPNIVNITSFLPLSYLFPSLSYNSPTSTVRCPQHCHSNTSCQNFFQCFLLPSYSPSELGLETTTRPIHNHITMTALAISTATQSRTSVLNSEEEPWSEHTNFKPERDISSSKQVRQIANDTTSEFSHLFIWKGSSENVRQEAARPQSPNSKAGQDPNEEQKRPLGSNQTSIHISTVMDTDWRSISQSRSGCHPVMAEMKKQSLRWNIVLQAT